jgi:hypothetical protein
MTLCVWKADGNGIGEELKLFNVNSDAIHSIYNVQITFKMKVN